MLLKEQDTLNWDGFCILWYMESTQKPCKILLEIVYPNSQKKRLRWSKGQLIVGINHYTTFYAYDRHLSKPKALGYRQDWNCAFTCKILIYYLKKCSDFLCIQMIGKAYQLVLG